MQVQLKPWGNSQGIRFSREFLASAGIKPDDVLTARVEKFRFPNGTYPVSVIAMVADEEKQFTPVKADQVEVLRMKPVAAKKAGILLACFDGKEGGTKNTVEYAQRNGCRVCLIPPLKKVCRKAAI